MAKVYQIFHRTAPFIAFILGVWYFCVRLLGYNLEYIPGDLGDSRFINYLLEHGHRWITGGVPSFWNAGFMYPFQNVIALSDNMLGTVPVYSVWRFFGFSQESSYQLWWICICSLNYWCSYLVFRKWFNRSEVAVILAWIFAFTIFNLGQLNYMQMIIRFMVPVVFYAAYRMVNTPSIKYLSIYCFCLILQFYSVMYIGFYLFYFSLLYFLIYCFFSKKWKGLLFYLTKEKWAYTSGVALVSFLLMLWLFLPYLEMAKIVESPPYSEVMPNLPLWNSFLFPHEASVTWRFLYKITIPDVQAWWLHYMFSGIILFMAMITSPFCLLYNWYKKIKTNTLLKSVIITSIIIILFHIRTKSGVSLYSIIFGLPGINILRVGVRFMHIEIFLLLLMIGYVLVRIKSKYLYLLFLIVFADNLFSPDHIPRKEKTTLLKRKEVLLTELEKYEYETYKAVALLDTAHDAYISNIDMMLVAQSVGVKTVNGYSSYCPKDLVDFTKLNKEEGMYQWLATQHIKKEEILLIKTNSDGITGP